MPVTMSIAGAQAPKPGNQDRILSWASVSQPGSDLNNNLFQQFSSFGASGPFVAKNPSVETPHIKLRKSNYTGGCWGWGSPKPDQPPFLLCLSGDPGEP